MKLINTRWCGMAILTAGIVIFGVAFNYRIKGGFCTRMLIDFGGLIYYVNLRYL